MNQLKKIYPSPNEASRLEKTGETSRLGETGEIPSSSPPQSISSSTPVNTETPSKTTSTEKPNTPEKEPAVKKNILSQALDALSDENNAGLVFDQTVFSKSSADVDWPRIVRIINLIITSAIEQDAHVIHIEAGEDDVRVFFRIDGFLYKIYNLSSWLREAISTGLKLLAKMDIEQNIRQIGDFQVSYNGQNKTIQVSTVPLYSGEKFVLEFVKKRFSSTLSDLGMPSMYQEILERKFQRGQRLILFSGLRDCGKTTSIYASLKTCLTNKTAMILEGARKPYVIPGVPKLETDTIGEKQEFIEHLILQDVDVIYLGKYLQDPQSAKLAFEITQSGHVVFASTFARNSITAFFYLLQLGIDYYTLASCLSLVICQSLARLNCEKCAQSYHPDPRLLSELRYPNDLHYKKGTGCPTCRFRGFRGRTGLFEVLEVNENLQYALLSKAPMPEITPILQRGLQISLAQSAFEQVAEGKTCPEEILRCLSYEVARLKS